MLTGERLQYLADLLPENVSWGDPLNAVMLDQILAAHSAGAQGANVHTCALCGATGDCKAKDPRLLNDCQGAWYRPAAHPQPTTASTGAQTHKIIDDGEVTGYVVPSVAAQPQPMPQTDAARDVLAERQRCIKACESVRDRSCAPEHSWAVDDCIAEIERLDRAKGKA
ncbi:hypothetical protein CIW54_07510 [Paraburkholderia sp. T12-10]|nr:hypothetical protein CIW54_07510 [Paraburkholderia sp. T12-10]